jgi:hypothetical protein
MGMEPHELRKKLEQVKGIHLGLDIGQKTDYGAIVVVQVSERPTDQMRRAWPTGKPTTVPEAVYNVHELRRLPLGTSFRDITAEVVNLVGGLWAWEHEMRIAGMMLPNVPQLPVDLWMDSTGMGLPIYELVKNALAVSPKTQRCYVHPVVFTYCDRFKRGEYEQGTGDVLGKAFLVNRLQVLFEQHTITLPQGNPQIDAMVQELLDYEVHVDPDANEKYGAFAVGAHDDLVTALGLACVEEPGYYHVSIGPNLWP